MKTYTICGSMRYEKEMKEIALRLETEQGYNILQCIYNDENVVLSPEALRRLEAAHYRKIAMSDGIYVLNIDGYIGESVQKEIQYAQELGKEIIYYQE